jgi:putative methionine-R-sulfoxide reductase with GAF domain
MLNKGIVSEEKPKPVLDEQTLAKLLEAAYVLQEHNREVQELELGLDLKRDEAEAKDKTELPAPIQPARKRDSATSGDYTFTLAQIVATQHQIQVRNLQLDEAMALVTERLLEMARADGAAIGMVEGRKVRYRAAAGARTLALGTEVASDRALCLPCIKNGQVFRCPDVNPEFLVDTEECRRRGIQSLIAVPIFHEGGVVAGLELYYSTPNGFTDQDVHTCQLMAGLITEALAREEEVTWKQSLASERAMMLEALEKLKPNLAALVEPPPAKSTASAPKVAPVRQVPADTYFCGNCGHEMTVGERFCGQCGTPRAENGNQAIPPIALAQESMPQSTFSAHSKPVPRASHAAAPRMNPDESLVESLAEEFPDLFKDPELVGDSASTARQSSEPLANPQVPAELSLHLKQELETGGDSTVPEIAAEQELADQKEAALETEADEQQTALATAAPNADWSSAQSAREFLEQVAAGKQRSGLGRFWDTRRGDIYLAIAVILVACVIRWGIWSNHSVGATATPAPAGASAPHKAPDADLSMFDRMLISLGLAEAPQVPEDKGNPSTQVWVDLHTALYYCPGADAYGKGAKGKFMTQRDAQLDSYEPAYRKACN